MLIVGIRRSGVLSLRFTADEMEALDGLAAAEGVGPAVLARTWILECFGRSAEPTTRR